ncbi:ultraviolet-B receptor UVR8 isoform X2 [Salvia miltiorrhiza]|uniref:ultraviolet-B receptor UVR8 isoform X2 n=1 Tax=Salvia miltiorrhiza TaxID=226208 RepID=UPI0025ABE736|nr:ultraviolet-B receptor UVR8 isoform X2 [Salvia miltiorrhiza]
MRMSRTHACMRKIASLSNLVNKKAGLGSGSRLVSAESGRSDDFGEVLSKGKRFAAVWGNGDFGRLGLGNLKSQWRPKPILPSAFGDQSLKEVASGGAHTLFLTENGDVYATGLNDFGQLGISETQDYSTNKELLTTLSSITRHAKLFLELGAILSKGLFVRCSEDGELYLWGKNANGQLGLGKKAQRIVPLPCKVQCLDGVAIRTISLGFEHSIAITDNGEALSWGGGESGRLGHGHESSILGFQKSSREYTPRLIKSLEGVQVKSVSAGMLHSACISDGSVYVFGEKELGKWGFGKAKNVTTPSTISTLPFSDEVACGAYHTCVITNGGELYSWGSNENGCLGIGCTNVSYSPERVQGSLLTQPVIKVSCGWKHTAAVSGGHGYTWGWGGSNGTFQDDGHSPGGQLGQGDDIDYVEPMLLDFHKSVKALEVSCGFNHTAGIFELSN